MKVTLRGGLTLAGCLVVCVSLFLTSEMWILLLLITMKYVFGDGAVFPFLKVSSMYHNFLQRAYFSWVGMLLEFGLGTRIAYTVVDRDGQEHLEQHYTTTIRSEGGGVVRHVDLDKYMSPPSQPGKAKIIIMNHHCRLDWLYMFIFFSRTRQMAKHIRFVLKGDLKQLPVLGWTMELFRYLFLSRSWENDEQYIQRMVDYYHDTTDTPVIFIFPEGTDLSASNVERSQAFAAKSGLPKFHRVLNPRTTGLVAIVKMLGGPERVEEILDFTIGYTYHAPGERPDEPSLINGHHPKKVHLLLHRYVLEGTEAAALAKPKFVVPVEDAKLAAWTHERFAEKEQLLSRFLVSNPIGFDAADVKAVLGKEIGLSSYDDDEERIRHPNQPLLKRYYQQVGLFGTVVVPVYWLASPVYFTFFTRWWLSALWTVAVLFTFAKGIKAVGGLEKLLFLTKVPPEATVMQRIRRFLAAREAKDRKRKTS